MNRRRFLKRASGLLVPITLTPGLAFPGVITQRSKFHTVVGSGSDGWEAQSGFSISGEPTLGSTVTITRAAGGFGTKPNAAKCVYARFWEDGDTTATSSTTICRSSTSPTVSSRASITATPPAGAGSHALQYNYAGSSGGGIIGPISVAGIKQYWFARTQTNFNGSDAFAAGGSTWNNKWWRTWFNAPGTHDVVSAFGQINATHGNPRITTEGLEASNATEYLGGSPSLNLFKNNWVTEQCRLLQSSAPDENDAQFHWIANGQASQWLNWVSRTAAHPEMFDAFYLPQEQNAWALTSFRFWCSEFYIDDSWCHAVLSSSPIYSESAGNDFEICPITAWSDTEVQIYMRPRVGSPHLHFMTNDGTTYYAGMHT